ncbi:hypothetical protein DRN94_003285, partial [archaeon]|nr:hypothetical protein [archaeon]
LEVVAHALEGAYAVEAATIEVYQKSGLSYVVLGIVLTAATFFLWWLGWRQAKIGRAEREYWRSRGYARGG